MLPAGAMGDAVLEDIRADMPGLNVVDWAFEMDGKKVRRARSGSSHEALLTFMRNRQPGETAMTAVQRELGIKPSALKKLKETLRDAAHATTAAL